MSGNDKDSEFPIERVLHLLDRWRHLPAYQLERRADVLFALYLPEVLEKRFGASNLRLIPEFPIRKSLLRAYSNDTTFQSINVDFLAVARANNDEPAGRAFLVELKTDMASRNDEQVRDLGQAVEVGLRELVLGVIDICFATNQKSKYVHLLHLLSECKLPIEYDEALFPVKPGYKKRLEGIQTRVKRTSSADWPSLELVYVQPKNHVIDFNEFADAIEKGAADGMRHTFASHLRQWAAIDAGEPDPKTCS